jgi:hypothetical protein
MKVGAVIPTRGDRPQFLQNALRQLNAQSVVPDLIEVVQDAPLDQRKDITRRYRLGCERLLANGADVVFFIEDDDYYSSEYVKTMLGVWEAHNRPSIFGIGETIYYHLGTRKWNLQRHPDRASAFCTMVTADALRSYRWPSDFEPFMDIHIWKNIKGKAFIPEGIIAIGIKHGIGLSGGIGHDRNRMKYDRDDAGMAWLGSNVSEESMGFYSKISEQVR